MPIDGLAHAPYPLVLEPILMPKVWGGRRLLDFGKRLPTADRYGESWEVADLPATSPSGAGGAAVRSVITNGSMAGRTLHEALELWGADLVGDAWAGETDFPLLVKLLDAGEHLSVQVHPTRDYVRSHPDAHLKSESWYVIAADPGAELFLGVHDGVDRDDIRAAVAAGEITRVLRSVSARVGDCHHVPSGTIHALGGGVVVAEVQSPSDTTFRLYDWTVEYGRAKRELHIEEALEALLLDPPPPPARLSGNAVAELARTRRYVLRAARGPGGMSLDSATCTVVMCVEGAAVVVRDFAATPLVAGSATIVPAALGATTAVDATSGTVLLAALTG
jgi:mannose-6-phosphate isomerase